MGTMCSPEEAKVHPPPNTKRRKIKSPKLTAATPPAQHQALVSVQSELSDGRDHDNSPKEFEAAVKCGNQELAMWLVDKYHDIDFVHWKFANGTDPLQMASRGDQIKLMLFLLEEGIDPNVINKKSGSTALFFAVQHGNHLGAALLMEYGADSTHQNKMNESPMTIALHVKDSKMQKILQHKSDADPSAFIKRQQTVDSHIDDILGGVVSLHEDDVHDFAADILSEEDLGTGVEVGQFDFDNHGVAETQDALSSMKGWLMMAGHAKKRYVVVIGAHVLWSKKKKEIKNDTEYEQRKIFEGWFSVMNIRELKKDKKNSFTVVLGPDDMNEKVYTFIAKTRSERDDWMEEIKQHQEHMLRWLTDEGLEQFMAKLRQHKM